MVEHSFHLNFLVIFTCFVSVLLDQIMLIWVQFNRFLPPAAVVDPGKGPSLILDQTKGPKANNFFGNNCLIYFGKWMEKVTCNIWKIKRSQPWTFHTVQSLRFRAISHLYWCSNSEVFADVRLPWKNPSVNSQWYIKKRVPWCGLGPIITISACN